MVRARSAALDSPSDRDTTILLNDGSRDDSGSGSEDGSVDDSSGKDFVDGLFRAARAQPTRPSFMSKGVLYVMRH